MRGVTTSDEYLSGNIYISTHTPHARRDEQQIEKTRQFAISTHTPHARRDSDNGIKFLMFKFISTHTPHARRDYY